MELKGKNLEKLSAGLIRPTSSENCSVRSIFMTMIDLFPGRRELSSSTVILRGQFHPSSTKILVSDFLLCTLTANIYEPTYAALNAIWPKLARGGILIFDEYGIHDWPGETAAVDQFLAGKPDLRLQTFDWTNAPAASAC